MDKTIPRTDWRFEAGYLYTLELDAIGLAWEYLRRNPRYTQECDTATNSAQTWHLHAYEDPTRDARSAQPAWIPIASRMLRVIESDDPTTVVFSLWRLPGAKTLCRCGRNLLLTITTGAEVWRLLLSPTLGEGCHLAFQLPGGVDPRISTPLISRVNAFMSSRRRPKPFPSGASYRPERDALLHMQTLRALDADAAGATHRDIAVALLGSEAVHERWCRDGDLRSRVRYLLRRGHKLVSGDYRRLLSRV